jgi:hypothetical protein
MQPREDPHVPPRKIAKIAKKKKKKTAGDEEKIDKSHTCTKLSATSLVRGEFSARRQCLSLF